jgi:hypothetical protein
VSANIVIDRERQSSYFGHVVERESESDLGPEDEHVYARPHMSKFLFLRTSSQNPTRDFASKCGNHFLPILP